MVPDFVQKTRAQILADYLRDVRLGGVPDVDVREGSHEHTRGTAIANALFPVYAQAQRIALDAFPTTASAEGLQRWATLTGLPRGGATTATGQVTVTTSFPTTIPDGSMLSNAATGLRYRTIGTTAVSTSGTVYVSAVASGSAFNVYPETALSFTSPPPGVNVQASVVLLSGGDDAWTDARWQSEIVASLRAPPFYGNVGHFQAAAALVGGLDGAYVYPNRRGAGSIDVVLTAPASSGSRVPSAGAVSKYLSALTSGVRVDGAYLPPLPANMVAALGVAAPVPVGIEVTLFLLDAGRLWSAWPGIGQPIESSTVSTTLATATSIAITTSGTAPVAGSKIGVFWPLTGFVSTTILSVAAAPPLYTLTTTGWSTQPTAAEAALADASLPIVPWHPDLPEVGRAIIDYFGTLGPSDSTVARFPVLDDISPITGMPSAPFYPSNGTIAANAQNAGRFVQSAAGVTFPGTAAWPPQIQYANSVFVMRQN